MSESTEPLKSLIRAYDHEFRARVIRILRKEGPKTVRDIQLSLKKEQSIVSQQLKILKQAALVNVEVDGKFRIYSVNEDRLEVLQRIIELART